MSTLDRLRDRLHRRKHNRERKRRLHQHFKVLREMRAIQHLRALIDHLRKEPRVMFDDTSVDLIPRSARAVAGYVNGMYRTVPELRRLFKRRRIVTICVFGLDAAHFLDIESGNASIGDAPAWWKHNKDRGARGFYIAESEAERLVDYLKAHGIHRHEYILWTAHHWGPRHICGRKSCGCSVEADGTQWTDRSNNRSLDESKLKPSFWRR
jgi:hypothetical protein